MNTIPIFLEDCDLIKLVHIVDELQKLSDEDEDYEVNLSQAVRAVIRDYKPGTILEKQRES